MCGITGIICFRQKEIKLSHQLQAMTDAVRHRGPDDEGFCLIPSSGEVFPFHGDDSPEAVRDALPHVAQAADIPAAVGFGHRRFSIIDLSESGHQPFRDPVADTVLVFNGEIYNYLELKAELESLGHGPFHGCSDTEVVSVAYRAWGRDCFERFNGFWALAIWDNKRRQVILSRDRLGKKPLYLFRPDANTLLFSSEIRSLMAGVPGGRSAFSVDPEAMLLYLGYDRRNTLKGCMWQEIELVDPATIRTVNLSDGSEETHSYWRLPERRLEPSEIPFDRALEEFKSIFDQAVGLRLRSDVPLAANLSGGMDSSAIVASAQEQLGAAHPLDTHLIRYRGAPELDENEYATAVADHTGCAHHELFLDSTDVWDQLDHCVDAFEEPVHSMAFMSQWLGWRAIRETGTKVILHGAAGDELLAGYSYLTDLGDFDAINSGDLKRYFSARPITNLKSQLRTAKWLAKGFVFPGMSNPLRRALGLPDRRIHSRDYNPSRFDQWFQKDFLNQTETLHRQFDQRFAAADRSLANRLNSDIELLRIPFWVNAMDKSMMEIPLEVRMPFLDHQLVDYACRLPVTYLYRDGWSKYILRRSMVGRIPDSIVWRKVKMGFTVPKGKWLTAHESEIRDLLSRNRKAMSNFVNIDWLLEDPSRPGFDFLWRCVNVAKWLEIFQPRIR